MRQCGVIASRPCSTRQDLILFHILHVLGSGALREKMASNLPVIENDTLQSPIFLELPRVNTDSFRVLLRTLAGLEDFARTTHHIMPDENVIWISELAITLVVVFIVAFKIVCIVWTPNGTVF